MKNKPSTKKWRALIRIEEINLEKGVMHVVVPGWSSEQMIPIALKTIPENVQKLITPTKRCYAQVNIGTENYKDLKFSDWEIS